MDENLENKGFLIKYVLWTIGITYLLWWTIVLANQFNLLSYGKPVMMIMYMIGGNAPPIVAITLILWSRKMPFKELIKNVFAVNQSFIYYALIIIIAALSYLIPYLLNKAVLIAPIYMSVVMLPFMVIGGGLEEIGWRYVLQPGLERKTNFVVAVLVTWVVWSLWHLPLFFMEGTNQYTWNFAAFAISVLGLSFFTAALYRISKSIWLCIFFHSLWNSIGVAIQVESSVLPAATIATVLIVSSAVLLKAFHKKNIE